MRFLFVFFLCSKLSNQNDISVYPVTAPVQHGEGPHWDPKNNVLYFVDTFQATVLQWDPYRGVRSFKLDNFDSVGVVLPIKNTNSLLVAADRTFMIVEWHDRNTRIDRLPGIEKNKERNQFNDGKADIRGNLWIGTLTRRSDLGVDPNGGSLYRVVFKDKRSYEISEKISNTSISNGIAWSRNNEKFYFADSDTRYIVEYGFDLSTGTLSDEKILFDLKNYPQFTGIPDGMTIDSKDDLWIALHGGSCVLQVDSKEGTLINSIQIPATYVTSTAFGGPKLDVLYVTTSRLKLTDEEAMVEPLAGSVFAVSGLGVTGLPANEIITLESTEACCCKTRIGGK